MDTNSQTALKKRFKNYWLKMLGSGSRAIFAENTADYNPMFERIWLAYNEPHRAYHTAEHLAELFDKMEENKRHIDHLPFMIAVIFWHDLVYKSDRDSVLNGFNNEEASAVIAEEDLKSLGFEDYFIEKVAETIRMTRGHLKAKPDMGDAALFLDMDISILAATPERFRSYCDQVREEFKEFTDVDFLNGRVNNFLATYADHREPLFKTALFRQRYENIARSNIEHELKDKRQVLAQIQGKAKPLGNRSPA